MPKEVLGQKTGSARHGKSELHASQEPLCQLLEKLPVAAYICDPDGLITFYNRYAMELWGRAPKLNHPADRYCGSHKLYLSDGSPIPRDQCWMAQALKMDKEFEGEEIVIEREDGTRFTGLAHVSPLRDQKGKLIGAVNVVVDISDRKRAEDAQTRLAAIVESTGDCVIAADLEGKIITWNQGAVRLFGYTADEILGKSINLLAPADRKDEWKAIFDRLDEKNAANHFESIRIARNGRRIDVSTTVSPVRDSSGKMVAVSAIVRDITARRETEAAMHYSERRFRLLLEATASVVWRTDPRGSFISDQPAWARFTGQTFDEYRGLGWLNAVHPDDRNHIAKLWQNSVANRSIFQSRARVKKNTGYCHMFIRAVPIEDDHAQVCEWIGSLTDITDTIRMGDAAAASEAELRILNETLERRVKERTAEAEARSRQLRALALDLADTESRERKRLAQLLHDHFQQLVSAAKLKTGLVRRTLSETKAIEALKQTENLLEQALTASRTLATELSPPLLTDGGLIPAMEWLCRKMEADYGLRVAIQSQPAAEPESEQIRTLIFECARELLFNVHKHANTKEASVDITMSPEGLLSVVVADRGRGFNSRELNIERRTEEPSFGLFSIRERLSFIGGLLNITTQPGKGTRMELSVPVGVRTKPTVTQENSATTSNRPFIATVLDRAARVLVADDHQLFREGMIHLLSQEPDLAVVGEAADGEQAVQLCKELKPDIIILDVSMPKLNGVRAAAIISRDLPDTRIIGLSMHEDKDMAKAMRAAGAAVYLTKGGSSDKLLEIVRSLFTAKPR